MNLFFGNGLPLSSVWMQIMQMDSGIIESDLEIIQIFSMAI